VAYGLIAQQYQRIADLIHVPLPPRPGVLERAPWEGKDPIAERRRGAVPTFSEAAKRTLAERRANWRGDGYARAWERTLERYVFPALGAMRVDAIRGDDVLRVLFQNDLWNRKPTTARRVRQQIRTVLSWGRLGEFVKRNVAGEAIDGALPKRRRRAKSHRALPHAEVRELLATVEGSRSRAAVRLCLRFLILTAARSGEARGARWSEIDVDNRTWTLSGERMKAGKEHRVPLGPEAVAVVERARQLRSRKGCELVFPGRSGDRELKDMALTNALWAAGVGERATVHGFRSTFSDWSAQQGNAPMLAEAALAHTVQGVEGAYRRTDLFDERRPLMDAWGEYVGAQGRPFGTPRRRRPGHADGSIGAGTWWRYCFGTIIGFGVPEDSLQCREVPLLSLITKSYRAIVSLREPLKPPRSHPFLCGRTDARPKPDPPAGTSLPTLHTFRRDRPAPRPLRRRTRLRRALAPGEAYRPRTPLQDLGPAHQRGRPRP